MHLGIRKAIGLLVGGLLLPAGGCRHWAASDSVPSPPLVAIGSHRPNARASELAAVLCVTDRYPWYMANLTPWRHSMPLLRQRLCGTLGVPRENVWTCENPDPEELLSLPARCGRDFRGKAVLFYLATHMKKDGRLLLSDGYVLHVKKLIGALNAAASIRVFMLDACFAASAERFGPFRADLSRWYAAGPNSPAQAFDRGFRSERTERFFAGVFGVPAPRIDDRSFFVLTLAGALEQATAKATASRPCTGSDMAMHLTNLATEFRRATGITRVPMPVCRGENASELVLFEPVSGLVRDKRQ